MSRFGNVISPRTCLILFIIKTCVYTCYRHNNFQFSSLREISSDANNIGAVVTFRHVLTTTASCPLKYDHYDCCNLTKQRQTPKSKLVNIKQTDAHFFDKEKIKLTLVAVALNNIMIILSWQL